MSESECPNRDQISHYAAGRLSAADAEALETHLSDCEICSDAFNHAADQSDPLLSQLKTPVSAEQAAYLSEPEFRNAVSSSSQLDVSAIFAEVVGRGRAREQACWDSNLIGRRLGQYELEEVIGQGGMGMVYRARHVKLDRRVAFKVLPHTGPAHEQLVQRFEREMQAVGRLQHPNIVQAFDADEMDGIHYLAMEYVDGPDLSALLKKHSTFPVSDACELVRQAAVGLQHAFEHGLVHRDVKPGNLMLDSSGMVKLLDLGLALLQNSPLAGSDELTSTGQLMGTVDYMAPEQAENTHEVDIRADIYSLGATLYTLLTGTPPFAGAAYSSTLKKMAALANDSAKPIRDRRPELSAELASVVDRMVAREPSIRFSTPAEVADALAPFAVGNDLMALLKNDAIVDQVSESSVGEDTVSHCSADASVTETAQVDRHAAATDFNGGGEREDANQRNVRFRMLIAGIVSIPLLAVIVFLIVNNPEYGVSDNVTKTIKEQLPGRSAHNQLQSTGELPVDSVVMAEALPNQSLPEQSEPTEGDVSVTPNHTDHQSESRDDGLRNILSKGGWITVKAKRSGGRQAIYAASNLPKDDFEVVEIYVDDSSMPLSDSDLKQLGSLPKLESLKLFSKSHGINSEGLRQIASCPKLRFLSVSSNGGFSEESLCEMAGLKHLKELSLFPAGGRVTGKWLDCFGENHPLEKLVLSPHLIFDESGMERLSKLSNLKSLTLTGHIVNAAGLKHLASLKKLEKLQIREVVPADALRQLGEDLPSLVSLTINVSANSLPSLQAFTNLEGLHLFAEGVTDSALLSLQTLSNLKSCRLEGDSFTAEGIAALQNKLPDCMIDAPGIVATRPQ